MMKLLQKLMLVGILSMGLVASPFSFADSNVKVSLNDAVAMVQQRFKATAVKTDTVQENGHVMYRIRLLSADRSRVWTVTVDAQTGQVR